jgi:hypothetical protein
MQSINNNCTFTTNTQIDCPNLSTDQFTSSGICLTDTNCKYGNFEFGVKSFNAYSGKYKNPSNYKLNILKPGTTTAPTVLSQLNGGGTIIINATASKSNSSQTSSSVTSSSAQSSSAISSISTQTKELSDVKAGDSITLEQPCNGQNCQFNIRFKNPIQKANIIIKNLEPKATFPNLEGDFVFGFSLDLNGLNKEDVGEIKVYIGNSNMNIDGLTAQFSNSPWVKTNIQKDSKGYYVVLNSSFKQLAITKSNYNVKGSLTRTGGQESHSQSYIFVLVLTILGVIAARISITNEV